MRIFKIIQKNDRYIVPIEDFEGYFVLEKDGTIRGFLDEPYHGMKKYLFGKYDESSRKMFFLKLTNMDNIAPLLFMFNDIDNDGMKYSIALSRFYEAGKRKIQIEEEEFSTEKMSLIKSSLEEFMSGALEQNKALILMLDEFEKNFN